MPMRSPGSEGKPMIRQARIVLAMPGKAFELVAAVKEIAAVIHAVAGVEVQIFASLGAQVGEMVAVSNFASLAEFEEKSTKILTSPEYQAAVRKVGGLAVPGATHDHLLRLM